MIGIPIGSPVGSLISDVFMDRLEYKVFHYVTTICRWGFFTSRQTQVMIFEIPLVYQQIYDGDWRGEIELLRRWNLHLRRKVYFGTNWKWTSSNFTIDAIFLIPIMHKSVLTILWSIDWFVLIFIALYCLFTPPNGYFAIPDVYYNFY